MNLKQSVETFSLFDVAMAIMATFGMVLGVVGLVYGGAWLWLTVVMAFCEILLAYGIFIAPRRISKTVYREALRHSPSTWIKLVFISDLHAGGGKRMPWYHRLHEELKNLKPDLLLVGGDLVVEDAEAVEHVKSLAGVQPTYGSFFILGNHDYQDDPKFIAQYLSKLGLYDLTNTHLTLRIQGSEVHLSGLDDAFYGDVRLPLVRGAGGAPHITLAHEPDALLDLAEGQTDLVLCGHAHGGQLRVPFFGSLHVPSVFGRKADQGRKVINGIPTIISRGLGEVGCRARLFAPPEIVIVELGI